MSSHSTRFPDRSARACCVSTEALVLVDEMFLKFCCDVDEPMDAIESPKQASRTKGAGGYSFDGELSGGRQKYTTNKRYT